MTRFKVVRLLELMQLPSDWQWPGAWHEEFRDKFEGALNRMAKEGWLYFDNFGWGPADLYNAVLIFRSEEPPACERLTP